jgi:hypothetical protein
MTISARVEVAALVGRTATGTRVHLADCPHLVGKDWHPATEAEIDAHPVCDWSRDQLTGQGRSHPATLEDAMREQGTPAGAVALIREHLKFVTYDEIWLPYSRSYVALGLDGRAVAGFGKTYVWVGRTRIDLPGYAAGRHTGRSDQPSYGETCPRCFLQMPLTGVCDICD